MWWLQKCHNNDKTLEKKVHPVVTWSKKHSLKQVVSITYALDKNIYAAVAFEGLRVV